MFKKIILFVVLIAFWPAAGKVFGLTPLELVNQSFLVGLVSLLAAASFLILRTGFLSMFFGGFKILGSFITPKSNAMQREDERARNNEDLAEFKNSLYVKIVGLCSLVGISSVTFSVLAMLV
ncbi:hypothetical protein A8F94_07610 [Bacillus sp. FJAT-27225]|uniref:DUF3899 domain-containing protein n=1 Tax=Bacillus sp. FJAT-27225 TaxID=1743144 RepID=UPI00080C2A03|nr:DUF3899 domain-containing protein [Bacillus sp. FJAT-27225]OCA87711.1 hypothetical protein A8F94_07610 [Bacillus sp. FJAT-27225]